MRRSATREEAPSDPPTGATSRGLTLPARCTRLWVTFIAGTRHSLPRPIAGVELSAQLTRNAASTGAVGEQYANGSVLDSIRGHTHMWHGGAIPGFISEIDRFPDDHAVVIVLTNLDGQSEIQGVASRLDDGALGAG
jgi:hypothetical protein